MRHGSSFSWRAFAGQVILLAAIGMLVQVSARVPLRQPTCPPDASPTTQSAVLKVKKPNVCTVTDGGYVQTWTTYKLHINAQVTGGCQTYQYEVSGLPPTGQCVPGLLYKRTLLTSWLRVNGTLEGIIAAYPSNDPNIQHYDTEIPTNTLTTGASWLTGSEGQFEYTSLTNADSTPCNLQPTQFSQNSTITMHAMACKPEWFTGGSPVVNFQAPASGDIQLVIPSSAFEDARGPSEQAAADWSAALGRNVTVPAGYATCTATDALCIELKDDHGTQVGDPAGCASFGTATYDSATGEWEGSTSVRFEPNWKGGHADNLRRTIAHELGHYFGLFNRLHSSCTSSNTIMGAGTCYGAQAPASGTALGPTASDIAALANSTYGNQVRSTCGW